MTREGDLVTINRLTGKTTLLYSIAPNPGPFFWSGLAFDGISTLYTANPFGTNALFKIVLASPTSVNSSASTVVGPTVLGGIGLQILGLDFYPSSAPVMPPNSNGTHPATGFLYGSNRTNDNIVVVDQSNGAVTFPFGNHTVSVNNLQEIAFHPGTGDLYAIHDHFSQSNNAALSVYKFSTETSDEWGELPFGIVETVGGGNDTYGWGGLAFAPSLCVPPPQQQMVAWYPFDEPFAAGSLPNTAAEIALGNAGTYFPAGPTGPTPIAGKVAWALNFDGIDDYVQSPSSPATDFGTAGLAPACNKGPCRGDFSIDSWIRLTPPVPTGVMTIVDKRSPVTGRGYHFFVFANRLAVQLADPTPVNYFSPAFVIADGLWHHVAVTVKRRVGNSSVARIRFYNNGSMFPPLSPITKTGSLANGSPLRIGTRTASSPLTAWFKGDIDELEIFGEELTPGRISQIFQADYFGKCK
jgi:concanavalin A-like lectin/glucanase superfamily protein